MTAEVYSRGGLQSRVQTSNPATAEASSTWFDYGRVVRVIAALNGVYLAYRSGSIPELEAAVQRLLAELGLDASGKALTK